MASQENLDKAYIKCAYAIAKLSYAKKKKVGAIIVKDNHIISEGVNGMPTGVDNNCEDVILGPTIVCDGCGGSGELYTSHTFDCYRCGGIGKRREEKLTTKLEVLHAESNAIAKIAKSHNSSEGSTLYCTYSPCFDCAKLIVQAGIKRVVYTEENDHDDCLNTIFFLKECKIKVDHYDSLRP